VCIAFHEPYYRNTKLIRAAYPIMQYFVPSAHWGGVPWLPHPRPGQRGVVSLAIHEPFQRLPPSLPLQLSSQSTSTNVPSIAARPSGKKAVPVPESWHRSKCMDIPNWLRGWETVWPHHSSLPSIGHRLLTLTTMLLNGPEYDVEYGSSFEVILKQRPQASPEAE